MTTESRRVAIVCGLKSSAAQVEHAEPTRLVRRMSAEYRKSQLYEWYQSTTVGKVAFDVDGKSDTTTAPKLLADALAGVATFFGSMPSRYLITASHGAGPGHYNGDKLSFRIVVAGVRMQMKDVKARLVRLELDKNRPFDAAIYGANQKLRMAGSIKTQQDKRPLVFIDDRGRELQPTPQLFMDSIVQVVEDEWELLEEEEAASVPKRSKPSPAPAPAISSTAVVAPSSVGRVPKTETLPDELRTLLHANGFLNVRPRRRTAGHEGYNFTCDNRSEKNPCPCCKPRFHDNHNYCAYENDDYYTVFNYSDHCNKVRLAKPAAPGVEVIPAPIGDLKTSIDRLDLDLTGVLVDYKGADTHLHVYEVPGSKDACAACAGSHLPPHIYRMQEVRKHHCWALTHIGEDSRCPGCFMWYSPTWVDHDLREILTTPSTHKCARLFERCFNRILVCDKDGANFKLFGNARRWVDLSHTQTTALVTSWLMDVVRKAHTVPALDTKEDKKALKGLTTFLEVASNQANTMKSVQGLFSLHPQPEFDTDPNLLGCDNCVIDLKAQPHVIRASRVEDYVSLSTGYDFVQPSERELADFQEFMAKIYPVAEERDFVQRFMGYSLTGEVTEQYFLILSDTRKGGNGKTTIQALMASAMGPQYSVREAKQAFLYTPRYADNLNSHDAGMLAFKDKRLVFFEELSSQYSLNTERLKQVTGGSCMAVRQAHSKDTIGMPWRGKVVLLFNEGKMPKFEAGEGALIRRMLVVQHRSKFCDDETYETERQSAYTFLKDPVLPTERFAPSVVLSWMLDGLSKFRAQALGGVPASVQGFKKDLVKEHDIVASWGDDAIEAGEAETDYVRQKDAVERFRRVTGEKMGAKIFKERLGVYMAGRGSRLVDARWHALEKSTVHSAYWGVRLTI